MTIDQAAMPFLEMYVEAEHTPEINGGNYN